MMLIINNTTIAILILGSSMLFTQVVSSQTCMSESLTTQFKELKCDTITLAENIEFKKDREKFTEVSSCLLDSIATFDSIGNSSIAAHYFALGYVQLTSSINAYIIRTWDSNERENSTRLYIIEKNGKHYLIKNNYLVGANGGSECCEYLTSMKLIFNQKHQSISLIISKIESETTLEKTTTIETNNQYFWATNDFKIESTSTRISYIYHE